MPNPRMKHTWVVHKSTAGILKSIPEAVDPVGNPPPALTTNTVAPLQRRLHGRESKSRPRPAAKFEREANPFQRDDKLNF